VPVAFADDKPRRQGGAVHGVPIRGTCADIPRLVEVFGIDLILLAVPSASAREMQRLVGLCEAAGKPFRTVPQIKELMAGQVAINQLRPVSLEDLLGRDPVTLDWDAIRQGLADKVVLVSGAGGSIGSELCRQLCRCGPRQLILVDQGEFNLYQIETELRESGGLVRAGAARANAAAGPARSPAGEGRGEGGQGLGAASQGQLVLSRYLLDITQSDRVAALFERLRPDVVFHAAAYKHVPLLEDQIQAALHNNVLGTQVMAEAAARWGCERFVLISTDKAVNPTNVMGATKRFAELVCQDLGQRSACRFLIVRFGNVLGSAGSVVPRFQRQIERGGPVTVTHPDVERFFMTIPEACQLIMQAAVIGAGGETFVLDMGEPVKIRYLAEQMIRLSGREPGRDIQMQFTGLRPGEKLYEELFYDSEAYAPTPHAKIHVARQAGAVDAARLQAALAALRVAFATGGGPGPGGSGGPGGPGGPGGLGGLGGLDGPGGPGGLGPGSGCLGGSGPGGPGENPAPEPAATDDVALAALLAQVVPDWHDPPAL
jgi:FlaA1/EpsC-like NDP-sugar epimerase